MTIRLPPFVDQCPECREQLIDVVQGAGARWWARRRQSLDATMHGYRVSLPRWASPPEEVLSPIGRAANSRDRPRPGPLALTSKLPVSRRKYRFARIVILRHFAEMFFPSYRHQNILLKPHPAAIFTRRRAPASRGPCVSIVTVPLPWRDHAAAAGNDR